MRRSGFSPEKAELIGVVLDLLIHADARRVSTGETVVEQNGTIAFRRRLQKCSHLARMQRIDTGVAIAGEEHDCRIFRSRPAFDAR